MQKPQIFKIQREIPTFGAERVCHIKLEYFRDTDTRKLKDWYPQHITQLMSLMSVVPKLCASSLVLLVGLIGTCFAY